MTDLEVPTALTTASARARAEFEAADLVAPSSAYPCLGRVLPAVAGAIGVDEVPEARLVAGAARAAVGGAGLRRAGRRARPHQPRRARRPRSVPAQAAGDSTPLTSTFPSTTATAMGTFGVALPPGRTGMLGYTVRDPATGLLGNLVSWTGLPPAREWQRETTVFERLVAAGTTVTSIGPMRFSGSGLTEAALRVPTYRAAESLAARVDATVDALRKPGVAYLYWGDVDKAGHHHGWGSWQWGDALAELDASSVGSPGCCPGTRSCW